MVNRIEPLIDLEATELNGIIESAFSILGKDWFERQLKKETIKRAAIQIKDHSRQRVRHAAKHVILQWYIEYSSWRDAASTGSDAPLNQSSLLLANFASNLVKVQDLWGIANVLSRLRMPDEFLAAAFEIEVAASYLNRDWRVEFIETGIERSSDLKVTTDQGKIFWVECKCRDQMTGRDVQISKFWEQLQDKLCRVWMPEKCNIGITLKAESDPIQLDLQGLVDAIFQSANILVRHPEKKRMEIRGKSKNNKYEFSLFYISDPDEELQFSGFNDMGSDWFEMQGEFMQNDKGQGFLRNPKFFGFTNKNPPDKYVGVLNAFGSAVGQLPESGPGVIWIRVPCPTDTSRAQGDIDAMLKKLERELSGAHNTRVNCVILSVRFFTNEPNNGRPALTYSHLSAAVEHKNPRHLMQ